MYWKDGVYSTLTVHDCFVFFCKNSCTLCIPWNSRRLIQACILRVAVRAEAWLVPSQGTIRRKTCVKHRVFSVSCIVAHSTDTVYKFKLHLRTSCQSRVCWECCRLCLLITRLVWASCTCVWFDQKELADHNLIPRPSSLYSSVCIYKRKWGHLETRSPFADESTLEVGYELCLIEHVLCWQMITARQPKRQ